MSNTQSGGVRDWSSGSSGSAGGDDQNRFEGLADSARDKLHDVRDSLTSAAESASETMSDAAGRAADTGRDALGAIEDFVRANPLTAIVGTAAAGAIIAMALSNRGGGRSSQRTIMRDMSRYSDDLRREMRQLVNEDRISKLVNALPTAEVSKAVSPWIAQVMEAMTAAKGQAKKAVADTAQTVHDRLS